jgi:hypothetical protein
MVDDGYQKGLRGGSVFSTNDTLGWAAGDLARKNQENTLQGEDHPDTLQILILMAVTGCALGFFTEWGWNPFGYLGSFFTWAVSTFLLYKILCLLPNWFSGAIMGLLLGGGAAYLGWIWSGGDLYWTGGAGLGTGSVMYFLFGLLE